MAVPNLSELVTTTLRHRSRKLSDNVTANNALLARLKERGRVRLFSGGREIAEELTYAENGSFKRYSGYEQLSLTQNDVISAATYPIVQAAVAVQMSGLEELQNASKEQMIDLLESRIMNAEATLANNIASDIYSDGTEANQITGLQALVADSPGSDTVGNISSASFPFWTNVSYDATTDGGGATTTSNIQTYMNAVYVQLVRGTDKPDLIVMDNTYFKLFLGSLQTLQRFGNEKLADLGFTTVKYLNSDVVLDGGSDQAASGTRTPTQRAYFLNTKHLSFRPHRARNFVPLEKRTSFNADAMVQYIVFAGNMTMSNRALQGVLKE